MIPDPVWQKVFWALVFVAAVFVLLAIDQATRWTPEGSGDDGD